MHAMLGACEFNNLEVKASDYRSDLHTLFVTFRLLERSLVCGNDLPSSMVISTTMGSPRTLGDLLFAHGTKDCAARKTGSSHGGHVRVKSLLSRRIAMARSMDVLLPSFCLIPLEIAGRTEEPGGRHIANEISMLLTLNVVLI